MELIELLPENHQRVLYKKSGSTPPNIEQTDPDIEFQEEISRFLYWKRGLYKNEKNIFANIHQLLHEVNTVPTICSPWILEQD